MAFLCLVLCSLGFNDLVLAAPLEKSLSATPIDRPLDALPPWTQSVVKLWFNCGVQSGSGTGVIVSPDGFVITAAHVGRGCDAAQTTIQVGRVVSPYRPPRPEFPGKLLERWTDNLTNPSRYDLALLHIEAPRKTAFTAIAPSPRSPLPGDPISVVGFSDLPFQPLEPRQEANLSIFKTALISVAAEEDGARPVRLHYGGGSLAGMSGGAVLDAAGRLIGIHSGRTTADLKQLLNEDCQDTPYQLNQCDGNALRIPYQDAAGRQHTQVIHLDYLRLKALLENYSWATGLARIPPSWLQGTAP